MSPDHSGKELVRPEEKSSDQLEMFSEMVALERERIASRNQMVAVLQAGFEGADAADKRHYEFQMNRLARNDRYRNRRLTNIVRFGWYGAAVVAGLLAIVVYALFWGTPEQRAAAVALAGTGVGAAAGFLAGRHSQRAK